MPQQQTTDDIKPDDITDVCTNHRDKLLEFYCNTHKSIACYVCVRLEHKQCKVDYIPDVSGNISDEFNDLVKKMEILVKKCESNIRKAQNATKNLDQAQRKVIEEIRLFRKEIDAHLDEMESRLIQESEILVDLAKHKLETVKDACLEIAKEMKSSQSFVNILGEENKNNKQFIEMKNLRPRVMTLTETEIQAVEDNKTDDGIEFAPYRTVIDQKLERSFGMISTYNTPTEDKTISIRHDKTINLKSSDSNECDVHGMVLVSNSKLILADSSNSKIKMIDVQNGSLVSEMTLSSEPRDVINLPENKLAVALTDEKCIQIMTYNDIGLSSEGRIEVGERCYCVAYCQGKLVVGCNYQPGKLFILDLDGKVRLVFDAPGSFAGPEKIIISSDEKFMYISDGDYFRDVSRVIKMNWEGNVEQIFEHSGYKRPKGIQEVDDNTLLVCYWKSNSIVRLSSSFDIYEVEGSEKRDILLYPTSLAYSKKRVQTVYKL